MVLIETKRFWENNIYYIFLTVHCNSCDVFILQSVQRLTLIRKANTFETETLNDIHMLSLSDSFGVSNCTEDVVVPIMHNKSGVDSGPKWK